MKFKIGTMKNSSPKIRLIFAALLLLFVAFLSSQVVLAQTMRTITDMAGRKVQIPGKVSSIYVNNHCAIMVYAFDQAIAVNKVKLSGDYPSRFFTREFLEKPYTEGNAEEIIKLHPDIVLTADEINPQSTDRANKLQEKIKIPVVILDLNMLKYKEAFVLLGAIISQPKKAQELIDFVSTYIDPIELRAKQIPEKDKVKVYYAEGLDGLSTEPSGSKHSQILDFIGANNVAKVEIATGTGLSQASIEQLLIWQPEVILVWTGSADKLVTYKHIRADPIWNTLTALKNKKVYQIPWQPFGWFDRPPGINRILGIIWTANLLYPEIFKYDMVKVAQEYFRKFYHYNLSVSEAKMLLSPESNSQNN